MEKAVVLFVDDEEDFRLISIELMRRFFKNIELEFMEAGSGEEALELLAQGAKPSIIILDYCLGNITGLEVIRRIDRNHRQLSAIPRVIITGYLQDDVKRSASELKFAYFEKEFDSRTFYGKICRHIVDVLNLPEDVLASP